MPPNFVTQEDPTELDRARIHAHLFSYPDPIRDATG